MKACCCLFAILLSACSGVSAGATTTSSVECQPDAGLQRLSRGLYREALSTWAESAARGDTVAGSSLAVMAFWGMGDESWQTDPRAHNSVTPGRPFFAALEKCANAGRIGATLVLGTAYLGGVGVMKDAARADEYFSFGVRERDALAVFGMAVLADRNKDEVRARDLVQRALSYSSELDAYFVGYQYFRGHSFTQDYAQAAQWFARGVEQNDWRSQGALSYMYLLGLGVPRNQQEADRLDALARKNPNVKYDSDTEVISEVESTRLPK